MFIKVLIILTRSEFSIFLVNKIKMEIQLVIVKVRCNLCPSFPFKNLSSLICSCGVKLYVLKDLGVKVSFNLILWSQGLDSRKCAAFSSEKTSRKSWNSFGFCSSNGKTFFLRLISACI